MQASILHRAVPISLLKCSLIYFSSTEIVLPWYVIPLLMYLGGSLVAVADIVNDMESNPDAFADASDTEYINSGITYQGNTISVDEK